MTKKELKEKMSKLRMFEDMCVSYHMSDDTIENMADNMKIAVSLL